MLNAGPTMGREASTGRREPARPPAQDRLRPGAARTGIQAVTREHLPVHSSVPICKLPHTLLIQRSGSKLFLFQNRDRRSKTAPSATRRGPPLKPRSCSCTKTKPHTSRRRICRRRSSASIRRLSLFVHCIGLSPEAGWVGRTSP